MKNIFFLKILIYLFNLFIKINNPNLSIFFKYLEFKKININKYTNEKQFRRCLCFKKL